MKCNRGKYNAGGVVTNPNERKVPMTTEQKRETASTPEAMERRRVNAIRAASSYDREVSKYGKDGMKARSEKAVSQAIKKIKDNMKSK